MIPLFKNSVSCSIRVSFRNRVLRQLSDTTRKSIASKIQEAPVVLFMKGTPEIPQCGFSRAAVQILGLQGVDPAKLKTHDVLENRELREGIKEFSKWPTIPHVYVNQEFIGGCDILVSMHQSGELETLLEKAGVLVPEYQPDEYAGPAQSS
ncbi:Monothiol glutaredoxin-5, mitochondrial [Neolecta irregularis DAH-3]|uniref:Monothiol glutaredoxin-5, mitochondrial n=1 Tax=Neolecta irregularis (strain DAH-3) TaxID=1198029 RepID=A0A1U7LS76_NEOID|nr:Monothiol glutaredoxin-5, mitochondrial [Neolecta irregularis DAH-3]|eukprot:OLL25526.1 Monothiol glutaredoxin-5, mitochondrial [Neolecta irregularis DAH-3]